MAPKKFRLAPFLKVCSSCVILTCNHSAHAPKVEYHLGGPLHIMTREEYQRVIIRYDGLAGAGGRHVVFINI